MPLPAADALPTELLGVLLRLPIFALVAGRLGGLLMFQPVFGALSVPIRLRVLFVLALAALITPLVPLPADAPDTPLGVLLAIFGELLLGLLLGLVTSLCFLGMQFGGLLIAQESGLAYGQIVDPTNEEQDTVVGVFYLQLALVVYLILGGHRALLSACLDTFGDVPLLAATPAALLGGDLLVSALVLSTSLAIQVAGPVLLTLFLVNAALGFVSRSMPALNVLLLGFPLKAGLAFLLMAVGLPAAIDAFSAAVQEAYGWIDTLLAAVPQS
ncbi:MAG: flagellar biosynthetic protein FliR [Phycisphaerales bacterium]|nr:flagellar biosynthetic protein FliR [Phycisphaerales bacterium]